MVAVDGVESCPLRLMGVVKVLLSLLGHDWCVQTQASKVQGQLFVCPTRAGDKRVEICFAMEKAEEHPNFLSEYLVAESFLPSPLTLNSGVCFAHCLLIVFHWRLCMLVLHP